MKIQKQRFRHDPDNRVYGDCMRTCYAILLGVDAEYVPHFMESGAFDQHIHDSWLAWKQLILIRIPFPGHETMEAVMNSANVFGSGMPYILSGWSRTPSNHCVICQGTEIVCDPSLNDSGITGPMHVEDGTESWWIEFLVRKL